MNKSHSNLIKVGNEFVNINDWMKVHKNQLQTKGPDDMVPIGYDSKNIKDAITDIILLPNSDETKQFWQEINNYKLGQTKDTKVGYQYLIGRNFPFIYKSEAVKQKSYKEKKKIINVDGLEDTEQTDRFETTIGTSSKQNTKRENSEPTTRRFRHVPEEKLKEVVKEKQEAFTRPVAREFAPVKKIDSKINSSVEGLKSSLRLTAGFSSSNHPIFQQQKLNADLIKFTSSPFIQNNKRPTKFVKKLPTSQDFKTPINMSPKSPNGARTSHRYKRH